MRRFHSRSIPNVATLTTMSYVSPVPRKNRSTSARRGSFSGIADAATYQADDLQILNLEHHLAEDFAPHYFGRLSKTYPNVLRTSASGSEADVTKLASPRGLAGYASNVEIDFGDAVEKAYSRKAISERKSQPLVNAVHLALDLVTATPKAAADFSVTLIAQS
jgi:hypothetical protein